MRLLRFMRVVALVSLPGTAWGQGNPVGPEFRVNTFTSSRQELASVASDSSGNLVVVWESFAQDGWANGIFGQRYAASGIPLGPEFRVNTYTTEDQRFPSVASDLSGNFVVVWDSAFQGGSFTDVFGQRYAANGLALGAAFRVNSGVGNYYQGDPSVAADAAGNVVVVWQTNDFYFSAGIVGQRYASSGAPLGPEFRVNTQTTLDQGSQRVAMDSGGNFVVVWQSRSGSNYGIFARRYASTGAPLGGEFRVNTYTTADQKKPWVAVDGSGNFFVVWSADLLSGSGDGVFGQRYASSGLPLGAQFRVNTYTTGYQGYPSVAAESSGGFVVIWSSDAQDGSDFGVFGQRYASSGAPLGTEFRVNTYTTGFQGGRAIAVDASGKFVVVWRSDGQDGSERGVFGPRYSQIVPVELLQFGVE